MFLHKNTRILEHMTSDQYLASLKEIDSLKDLEPEPHSDEGERLLRLVSEVEVYESRLYPLARIISGI